MWYPKIARIPYRTWGQGIDKGLYLLAYISKAKLVLNFNSVQLQLAAAPGLDASRSEVRSLQPVPAFQFLN